MTYPRVVYRHRCSSRRLRCLVCRWHVVVMPTWHGESLSEWAVSSHLTHRAAIRATHRWTADGRARA